MKTKSLILMALILTACGEQVSVHTYNNRISDLEHRADLNDAINIVQTTLININTQNITVLQDQVTALQARDTEQQEQNAEVQAQIAALQGQDAELQAQLTAQLAAQQEQNAAVQAQICHLQHLISTLSSSVTYLTNNLSSLQDQVDAQGADLTSLDARVTALENESTLLQNAIQSLNDRLDAMGSGGSVQITDYTSTSCTRIGSLNYWVKSESSKSVIYNVSTCASSNKVAQLSEASPLFWVSGTQLATILGDNNMRLLGF